MSLTAEALREFLRYDPETGTFIWLKHQIRTDKIGRRAGGLCKRDGYIIIAILGHRYPAQRLAWLYMTGEWPAKPFIDHINRDRSDNCWVNLREATNAENCRNSSRAKGVAGLKGVTLYHSNRKNLKRPYAATIMFDYKPIRLGYFETPEEAHAAYIDGAKKYHGEFASIA